uniref:Sodium- and chloride-dependent glycine transporter 2-like n=1 Tax=Saccoglossus kowalevskii TaxID=10224 RepID=A0ABM0MUZ5_SACKO
MQIPKCCGVSKSHEITSEEDSNYGDENVERGNWSGKLDFILSLIGYAVGMSNIWRFPILCYRNGGGAFLIPYVIFMMLCGMPLFFLEVAFGQFCSEGPITAWKVCRLFRGAGYAMIIITGLTTIYYNVLIMYILYYFIASFTAIPGVPWSECNNEWNTPACAIVQDHANITNNNTLLLHQLRNSGIHWDLALILLLTWLVIFMCLIRGIKTSGKVVYVTATFPYIVITILILRGVTLPGSLNGLKFFFIPRWELLASAKVWSDAATQVFFSLGPSWGGLLTMASYNKFHNNCLRDSVLVPIVNGATSIYCGIAVFSILGFLSKETGVELDKVVQAGPGLVFVVYPEALSRIPLSAFWSALFFLMMFTVCLDSQFVMVENVCSAFIDNFPKLLRPKKSLFVLFVCMVSYVLGLPMTTS